MSEEKERFSARVRAETKQKIDDYAEREGLNRSQAVERITQDWGELTDNGQIPVELVLADPGDAVPGETTGAADTAEAAQENASTMSFHGGVLLALGSALYLYFAGGLAAPVALAIILAGTLNWVGAVYGFLVGYTSLLGSGPDVDADSPADAEEATDA